MFSFQGSRPPRPTDKPRPTMQTTLVTGGTLLVAPVSGFFRPSTLNLALRAFYAARAADRYDHPAGGGATQVCPVPLDNYTLPQGGLNVNTFFAIFSIFFSAADRGLLTVIQGSQTPPCFAF